MERNSKKVSRADFERLNTQQGIDLIHRESLGKGVDVFISEGTRRATPEMDEPHWLVTWALTRDETVEEARVIRVPSYLKMPVTGITTPTTRADRQHIALKDAKKWFEQSSQTGWA